MQVVLFWILPSMTVAAPLTAITFIVLMCYGGGFGTMPAFTADYFGSKTVGPIYGLTLTAWSVASAFGPLLIAHIRETSGNYRGELHIDRDRHARFNRPAPRCLATPRQCRQGVEHQSPTEQSPVSAIGFGRL